MFGFGKQKTVKAKKKITGQKMNGLTPIAPDEFFDGLNPARRVYGQGGMMGQNIALSDMRKTLVPGNVCGHVSGHWTPIPSEGDYLKVNMSSGNVGVYQMVNIKDVPDVHDMFFADIIWLCYEQYLGGANRETFKFDD